MYEKELWFTARVHQVATFDLPQLRVQQQNTAVVLSSSQVRVCDCVNAKQLRPGNRKDAARLARHTARGWDSKLQELLLRICVRLCVLTKTVGQEVGGEALGAVAHGRVVVRVSSEHQHGPAHDLGRVEVTEEAAVSQDGPAQNTQSWLFYSCFFQNKNACGCLKMSCICCNRGLHHFLLSTSNLYRSPARPYLLALKAL